MGLSFPICKMEREDGSEGPSSTRGRKKENYLCTLSCLSPSTTVGTVLSLRKFTQSSNLDLSILPSLPYQLTDRCSPPTCGGLGWRLISSPKKVHL